ncbi:MAG: Maf family protein [Hyphomicrobiales bacterium]|nr:Maf family protein [Hyphomicrobiales bacterium]
MNAPDPFLILASASATRRTILTQAEIPHVCEPSGVDEETLKEQGQSAGRPVEDVALDIARAKAAAVSARNPRAYVLGADQMMECGGRWLDKPANLDAARHNLRFLRGRTHRLISAATVWRDGEERWTDNAEAHLGLRAFSDAFLDDYLRAGGDEILASVGAYRLEGLGVQLFDRIDGDYFTILGLPLLPLMAFLRREGMLAT